MEGFVKSRIALIGEFFWGGSLYDELHKFKNLSFIYTMKPFV